MEIIKYVCFVAKDCLLNSSLNWNVEIVFLNSSSLSVHNWMCLYAAPAGIDVIITKDQTVGKGGTRLSGYLSSRRKIWVGKIVSIQFLPGAVQCDHFVDSFLLLGGLGRCLPCDITSQIRGRKTNFNTPIYSWGSSEIMLNISQFNSQPFQCTQKIKWEKYLPL